MQEYKTMLGFRWVLAKSWGDLKPSKGGAKVIEQSGCAPGVDDLVVACFTDQTFAYGKHFVLATPDQLVVKVTNIEHFLLEDISAVRRAGKNIEVVVGSTTHPLLPADTTVNDKMVATLTKELIHAWKAARVNARAGGVQKESAPAPKPRNELKPGPRSQKSGQQVAAAIVGGMLSGNSRSQGEEEELPPLKVRLKSLAIWSGALFVYLIVVAVATRLSATTGGLLALAAISAGLLYRFVEPSREMIGRVIKPHQPGRAGTRVLVGALVGLFGIGLGAPKEEAQQTQGSASTSVAPAVRRQQAPWRRTRNVAPPRRRVQVIAHKTVSNQDSNNPVVHKIVRTLLVKPGHSNKEVYYLLREYYDQATGTARSTDKQKLVFMYVYDSQERIDRGAGEWIAMLQISGKQLPRWPSQRSYTMRVPDYQNAPSPQKQKIYEALQTALHAKENKGIKEKVIHNRVARKLRVSKKKLDKIWMEVNLWRTNAENEATKQERIRRRQVQEGMALTKKVVADKGLCDTPLRISQAWKKIRLVRRGDRVYRKAKYLVRRLERCRRSTQKQFSKGVKTLMSTQRRRTALVYQNSFRQKGFAVRAWTSGKWNDRFSMKYVGFTRTTVDAMVSQSGMLNRLQRIGFKRATFSNGYRQWTYTLKPPRESGMGSRALGGSLGLSKPLRIP